MKKTASLGALLLALALPLAAQAETVFAGEVTARRRRSSPRPTAVWWRMYAYASATA